MKKNLLSILFFLLTIPSFAQSVTRQWFEVDCNRSYISHIAEVDRSNNSAIISVREDELKTIWYIADVSSFRVALLKLKTSYSNFLNEGDGDKKEVKRILPISFPIMSVAWSHNNESPKSRNNLTITTSLIGNWGCLFAPVGSSSDWGKFAQLMIYDYDNGGINSGFSMDMEALDSLIDALK